MRILSSPLEENANEREVEETEKNQRGERKTLDEKR